MTYQQTKLIPLPDSENLQICVSGVGVKKDFSCIITDIMPDLELIGKSQCFPLYWYEEKNNRRNPQQTLPFDDFSEDRYTRRNAISDWFLQEVRKQYHTKNITKEDIFYYVYGLLHSPDYRDRFTADLRKSLPRIPIVENAADFMDFSIKGKKLAELHLHYETAGPCKDVAVSGSEQAPAGEEAYGYFRVDDKLRFKTKGDKSAIVYNSRITVSNIPPKAYEYVVNGKPAVEWIMERYRVSTDKKSLIRNDCNDWAKEHRRPRYILDLLLSVINVSVQTVDIVESLPRLHFD